MKDFKKAKPGELWELTSKGYKVRALSVRSVYLDKPPLQFVDKFAQFWDVEDFEKGERIV